MKRLASIFTIAWVTGLVASGCGDKSGPTSSSAVTPDFPVSSGHELALSTPSSESEPERRRGNLFGAICTEIQCELALRQGVVVVTGATELSRDIIDAAEASLEYPEFAELVWDGMPIRAVGTTVTSDGKLIAESIKIDDALDIEGIISIGSEELVAGAVFQLLVESYLGQIEIEVKVPNDKDKVKPPKVKFPPNTRVRIRGTVPKTVPPVSSGKPPTYVTLPDLPDGVRIVDATGT